MLEKCTIPMINQLVSNTDICTETQKLLEKTCGTQVPRFIAKTVKSLKYVYNLSAIKKNWKNARKECQLWDDGDLASIESHEERFEISKYLR